MFQSRRTNLSTCYPRFYETELRPLLARWLVLLLTKLGLKRLDAEEQFKWLHERVVPPASKMRALEREVWQVHHVEDGF